MAHSVVDHEHTPTPESDIGLRAAEWAEALAAAVLGFTGCIVLTLAIADEMQPPTFNTGLAAVVIAVVIAVLAAVTHMARLVLARMAAEGESTRQRLDELEKREADAINALVSEELTRRRLG